MQKSIREILRAGRPASVKVYLPADRKKAKYLLVSVNGVRYSIERGREVEVPWNVAQVIGESIRSDEAVARRVAQLEDHPAVTVLP